YELPGGPPSDDSILVTCAYLVDASSPWVLQSLFLAAIGEARDKGARGVEAFSYRYPEGESTYERFRVHKTVFPQDFLADFGFQVMRAAGRVGLSRLELGRLQAGAAGAGGGGEAREGAARRKGRVRRAGAGAGADPAAVTLSAPGSTACRSGNGSCRRRCTSARRTIRAGGRRRRRCRHRRAP